MGLGPPLQGASLVMGLGCRCFVLGDQRRLSQLGTSSNLAQAIAGSAPSVGFKPRRPSPSETGLELELIHLAFRVSLPQLGHFLA